MRTLSIGMILAISVFASACSFGPVDKGSLKDSIWRTDCGLIGRLKTEVRFTEKQMTYSELYYDVGATTSGCAVEDYRVSWVFNYTVGDAVGIEVSGIRNVRKVDFTLKNINVLPKTSTGTSTVTSACPGPTFTESTTTDVLADATAVETCGYATHPRIAGANLTPSGDTATKLASGAVIYQILGIEEFYEDQKNLYFGRVDTTSLTTDGWDEERRPSTLKLIDELATAAAPTAIKPPASPLKYRTE